MTTLQARHYSPEDSASTIRILVADDFEAAFRQERFDGDAARGVALPGGIQYAAD